MKLQLTHSLGRLAAAMMLAPGTVMNHIDAAVQRAAIEGARTAKAEAPKSLSNLVNSIRNVQLGIAFHSVVATARHAEYVETGTKEGGVAPLAALRRWIQAAGITPRDETMSTRDLAFVIQRKIARDGTPAQPYMEPAAETSRDRLIQLLPGALQAGMDAALAPPAGGGA